MRLGFGGRGFGRTFLRRREGRKRVDSFGGYLCWFGGRTRGVRLIIRGKLLRRRDGGRGGRGLRRRWFESCLLGIGFGICSRLRSFRTSSRRCDSPVEVIREGREEEEKEGRRRRDVSLTPFPHLSYSSPTLALADARRERIDIYLPWRLLDDQLRFVCSSSKI